MTAHNVLDDKSRSWKLTFISRTLAAEGMNDEEDVEAEVVPVDPERLDHVKVVVAVGTVGMVVTVVTVVDGIVKVVVGKNAAEEEMVVGRNAAAVVVAVVDSREASEVVVVAVM